MNLRTFTTAGSVLSAMASSACCWLPLLLMGFGLSAAGVGAFFESARPWFLTGAALLLALGFYLNYFRRESCEPGTSCEAPRPRWRRFNRAMLWVSTVFVLAFALFPRYVNALFGAGELTAGDELVTLTLNIDGMTCTGCEASIEEALAALEGVRGVDARFESADAVVTVDPDHTPSDEDLAEAVQRAGYDVRAVHRGPGTTTPTSRAPSAMDD